MKIEEVVNQVAEIMIERGANYLSVTEDDFERILLDVVGDKELADRIYGRVWSQRIVQDVLNNYKREEKETGSHGFYYFSTLAGRIDYRRDVL